MFKDIGAIIVAGLFGLVGIILLKFVFGNMDKITWSNLLFFIGFGIVGYFLYRLAEKILEK
ncbi:MAG: hypothetical protein OEZ39_12335 [Gammaproteobacteria bacterium]|nr:hypothetical protein [Gammaproteobacteria bacterium]